MKSINSLTTVLRVEIERSSGVDEQNEESAVIVNYLFTIPLTEESKISRHHFCERLHY